jgi:pimeloyl-ACP methyl ester carboxylesterase
MPTVLSGGVPIYYEVIGEGTPILLVHGFINSFESNLGQTGWVDFLLAQGHQVVGLDCRGHGLSGKPHDPSAYDGNRFADDVIAVMDAVGLERTDLMGYSMGGQIAINLLARRPERFTSVVAGGAGLRYAHLDPRRDQAATIEALETDDVSSITNPGALFMRQMAESRSIDPNSLAARDNDLKALAAVLRSSDPVRYASKPAEHTDALRRVQTLVLAVVGDKDTNLSEAQLLIDTVPFGELVLLPGEDHLSAVSSQKYKEAVASFLKAHAFTAA